MSDERDELARELFIADNFNQPREQSIVDWQWFMETPRFAVRIERYKAMAEGAIAAGFGNLHDAWADAISRVEVIDYTGRAYTKYTPAGTVSIDRQDQGRTLKVFITEGATK
jgi:hypothetical protein